MFLEADNPRYATRSRLRCRYTLHNVFLIEIDWGYEMGRLQMHALRKYAHEAVRAAELATGLWAHDATGVYAE